MIATLYPELGRRPAPLLETMATPDPRNTATINHHHVLIMVIPMTQPPILHLKNIPNMKPVPLSPNRSDHPVMVQPPDIPLLTVSVILLNMDHHAPAPRRQTSSDTSTFARWCGTGAVALSSGEGSGKPVRHRLDFRGNRTVNSMIYIASITQARDQPEAQAYLERKTAEGKTRREARPANVARRKTPKPRTSSCSLARKLAAVPSDSPLKFSRISPIFRMRQFLTWQESFGGTRLCWTFGLWDEPSFSPTIHQRLVHFSCCGVGWPGSH